MNSDEKKSIIDRYSKRLEKYGHSPESLGWDKHRHILRYYILLSQWEFAGKSILDFGCGFGDMYKYILESDLNVDYTGIDINADLINVGKIAYPDANLIASDALKDGLDRSYDFILSSGIHNLKLSNNSKFLAETFDLFVHHASCGFALNFISDKVQYRMEHINYTSPEEVLALAYKYSNRVVLRNDYMPFECTVFIDLRKTFDPDVSVYPEYLKFVPQR